MVSARPALAALLAALLLALPWQARAAVVATVDRDDVELNESFTLKITVDTEINQVPDVSRLEQDFHVLDRSELTNTMIVNGQISRSRTWSYMLMPKRTGELEIPEITVGVERSRRLSIQVAPPSEALPGESDVFVTAEVDYDETYVQAQLLYTVKVYRAVATRQPRLSEPEIGGVDALLELSGDEKSYESIINGKSYNVVERTYALFPQASGELTIAPLKFEARVLRDGRITGRKVFQSEAVRVHVRPIPPPPPGYPDAEWFPARAVELGESWSRDPETLPAGVPITRHLTVTAAGQLSTQIPAIKVAEPDGVKLYPDKPELRVAAAPVGIVATRKDQYAMIATGTGDLHLPSVDLPWWSIDEQEWRVASLPARTIEVVPSADAMPELAVAALPAEPGEAAGEEGAGSAFWRSLSLVLGAAWAGTLLLWWISRRSPRRASRARPEAPPVHRQQARRLKEARRAAAAGDIAGTRAALLAWGRLTWPEGPPRSVGEMAMLVDEPLAGELAALGRASYGPAGGAWDGSRLAAALRTSAVSRPGRARGGPEALPPLMPRA